MALQAPSEGSWAQRERDSAGHSPGPGAEPCRGEGATAGAPPAIHSQTLGNLFTAPEQSQGIAQPPLCPSAPCKQKQHRKKVHGKSEAIHTARTLCDVKVCLYTDGKFFKLKKITSGTQYLSLLSELAQGTAVQFVVKLQPGPSPTLFQ